MKTKCERILLTRYLSLFPVQDLALSTDEALPVYNRCAVHAIAAAYLNLICQLTTVPAFCQHIHEVWLLFVYTSTNVWILRAFFNKPHPFSALQVIEMRQKERSYLLPEDVFIDNPKYVLHNVSDSMYMYIDYILVHCTQQHSLQHLASCIYLFDMYIVYFICITCTLVLDILALFCSTFLLQFYLLKIITIILYCFFN